MDLDVSSCVLGRRQLLVAAAAWGATTGVRAKSSPWPSRPVKLVVSGAGGSPPDLFARLFAEQFAKTFGQPFVIDNKVGATGLIGNDAVAKSPPDGYTLLFTYAASVVGNQVLLAKRPYDALKDLQPIAQVGQAGSLLVVGSDFPAKSLREFVDVVRAHPDQYQYATWGQASGGHVAMESLKTDAQLKIDHVPYKGMVPILTDLQGGVLNVACVDGSTSLNLIKSGRVRPLAVFGTKRMPGLPDVPTLSEAGYKFNIDSWYGLFAPAGTPAALVQRLNAEVNRVLQLPDMRARMQGLNMPEAPIKTAEQFAQTIRSDIDAWARVIKAANVKAE